MSLRTPPVSASCLWIDVTAAAAAAAAAAKGGDPKGGVDTSPTTICVDDVFEEPEWRLTPPPQPAAADAPPPARVVTPPTGWALEADAPQPDWARVGRAVAPWEGPDVGGDGGRAPSPPPADGAPADVAPPPPPPTSLVDSLSTTPPASVGCASPARSDVECGYGLPTEAVPPPPLFDWEMMASVAVAGPAEGGFPTLWPGLVVGGPPPTATWSVAAASAGGPSFLGRSRPRVPPPRSWSRRPRRRSTTARPRCSP
eukprot:TRINITY_DN1358_c0_g2_i2.p2 TRINITY_DN1358_c0_g2~~TRINITY_DN1358_c0_g2_i2.p2  ORF type:complete len:301 (-),score=88.51 TRINITY_DN1358_c0_g2_i2:397-1164(-)